MTDAFAREGLSRSRADLRQSTRIVVASNNLTIRSRPTWMRYVWLLLLVVAAFEGFRLSSAYSSVGHFFRSNFGQVETLSDLNHWVFETFRSFISSATGLGLLLLGFLFWTQKEVCTFDTKAKKVTIKRAGWGTAQTIPFDSIEGVETEVNAESSSGLTRVVLLLATGERVPVHTPYNHTPKESARMGESVLKVLGVLRS